MVELMTGRWWVFAVRGVAAVVFGLLALFWPGITLLALVILVGAYLIVDGAFLGYHAFAKVGGPQPRWLLIFQGALSLLLGLIIFITPGTSAIALVILFGCWAVVTGAVQIATAIRLRKEIPNEWLLLLSGALSVLVGIALVILPQAGALALVWLIGIYAILLGIALIAASLRLRAHKGDSAPGRHRST